MAQLVALANSPDAGMLKSAKTLLMMPDLFRYFLCGHKGVELTSAGTSQLINPRNRRWCAKVFQALHIPRRIVPELVQTATVVGRMSQKLATEVGLNRAAVVAVAGHDTASAIAVAPLAGEDAAFISCGTWLLVGTVEERPIITAEALRCGFINELGLESLMFVKGMTGLHLFEHLHRALRRTDQGLTYAHLIGEALQAKPVSRFLDVNSPQFFTVDDTASSVGDFLLLTGQKVLRSRGTLVRTLLEGLAWSCRVAVQDLGRLTGRTLRKISLVGGGVRNTMLCQMIADATGLEVIAGSAEATVIGNLAMQALATGQLRDVTEMRKLIQDSFQPKTYRPKATELWDKHAPSYLEIVAKGAG